MNTASFFDVETDLWATVFSDEACANPLAQPIHADAAGNFPKCWFPRNSYTRYLLRVHNGQQVIYEMTFVSDGRPMHFAPFIRVAP